MNKPQWRGQEDVTAYEEDFWEAKSHLQSFTSDELSFIFVSLCSVPLIEYTYKAVSIPVL
jgi:hypothetical protein